MPATAAEPDLAATAGSDADALVNGDTLVDAGALIETAPPARSGSGTGSKTWTGRTTPAASDGSASTSVGGEAAGEGTNLAVGQMSTPVGTLQLVVSEVGLVSVSWDGLSSDVTGLGLPVVFDPDRIHAVSRRIAAYFDGDRVALERIAIDWQMTSGVARTVLQTLHRDVPFGSTITYGRLATASGTGVPARTVGGIMAMNPTPVVVACHRVLSHDGLGGYSGGTGDGLETKQQLLAHEGACTPTLY